MLKFTVHLSDGTDMYFTAFADALAAAGQEAVQGREATIEVQSSTFIRVAAVPMPPG